MLQDAYSPDTGEHIPTDNPAAWMLRTGVAAPAYDPSITGCFWQNGAWVIVPAAIPTSAELLLAEQKSACSAIDSAAGSTRAKYITVVAGQSETYQAKQQDAINYKTSGYPYASIGSYAWINAEALAVYGSAFTAAQAQAAVDNILATAAAWITKGAQIEQARRAGSITVAAATTVAAVQSAQAAAVTALQAL